MSGAASPDPLSATAATLRAAGCVCAEEEARLLLSNARTPAELTRMLERRARGDPLEVVLGWAEFCGLRIAVEPGVFVPRPRTELLVREAVRIGRPGAVLVDMCCGSGAVGVAVAAALGGAQLHAVDVDVAAVRCARRNLAPGGEVCEGDLYDPLPATLRGRVDLLVVNPPYVPTDEIGLMPREAREHEPRVALDGGPDGLDVQRRVVADAPLWLAPGGHLLIETSERQAPRTREVVMSHGLRPRVVSSDEPEATVVVGTRPTGPAAAGG